MKDISNSKDEMKGIVEHSKEFTMQTLQNQGEVQKEIMDGYRMSIIQTQEIEKRAMMRDMTVLKEDVAAIRDESRKNDKILEKNLSELMMEFRKLMNNTIRPVQQSEDKVAQMESRQHELEQKFLQDHHFFRDLIRKLIYSMQSSFISARTLNEQIQQSSSQNLQMLDFKTIPRKIGESSERKLKET